MRIKTIILLILSALLLLSCKKDSPDNYFVISGSLSGLDSPELRFESACTPDFVIDTVVVKDEKFEYKNHSDSLLNITIRISDTSTWFSVWAKNGDQIKITGNVQYPGLIEVTGGEVNDQLTQFKNENKETIRKKRDLKDKLIFNREEQLITPSDADNYSEILHLEQLLKDKALTFVQENPNSIASLVLIQDYVLGKENIAIIQSCLEAMGEAVKSTALYTQISRVVSDTKRVMTGSPAPDFSVIDIKNDTLSLKHFENNYLLLTFAQNEKDTCSSYFDSIRTLYEKDKKLPLNVLTVVLEKDTLRWKGLPKETKNRWYQVIEREGWRSRIAVTYCVLSVSDNYLIDKNGIIIGHNLKPDSIRTIIRKDS